MSNQNRPASLRAVLAFTAIANLATAIATVGVFFLAESAQGFTTAENYQLGLLMGVTYTIAAWKAGALLSYLARRGAGLSARATLVWMSLAMAALCFLPYLWATKLAIYVFVAVYAPLTGIFWSIVESFLSGGRSGEGLRKALSQFNVTWSAFMALSMWMIAPLVAHHALEVFLGVAGAHVLSLVFLARFQPDPARHVEGAEHAPARYTTLLRGHRILLVASYLMMFALSPYLPELMKQLDVPAAWRTALGSVWMPVRVGFFYWLGAWQAWHGRRSLGAVSALLLLLGFGLTVAAPYCEGDVLPLAALVLGQLGFGIAIAALYTANIYYTMAVGHASVDASGSHEGLIGLGYTIGPMCGWLAGTLARHDLIPPERVDALILGSVEGLGVIAVLWAWRCTRPGPELPSPPPRT